MSPMGGALIGGGGLSLLLVIVFSLFWRRECNRRRNQGGYVECVGCNMFPRRIYRHPAPEHSSESAIVRNLAFSIQEDEVEIDNAV
jgi:hypothetical protein